MACACKVNRDLEYLMKHYGVKQQKEKKPFNIKDVKTVLLKNLGAWTIALLLTPIMLIFTLCRRVFGGNKPINITKLFGIHGKQ